MEELLSDFQLLEEGLPRLAGDEGDPLQEDAVLEPGIESVGPGVPDGHLTVLLVLFYLPDGPDPPPEVQAVPGLRELHPLDVEGVIHQWNVDLGYVHGGRRQSLDDVGEAVGVHRAEASVACRERLEQGEGLLAPDLADYDVIWPVPEAYLDEVEDGDR